MKGNPYTEPVAQLVRLGWPESERGFRPSKHDYVQLGLTARDVPEMIRLACDEDLRDSDQERGAFGPQHAWWALGQLRAEAAIQPLLNLLNSREEAEDDFALEGIPQVLGMIGPAAIEPAARFVRDPANSRYARAAAGTALEAIGNRHPEHRLACIEQLRQALAAGEQNEPDLNGFLVSNLIDLRAVEASETIELAFAHGWVDDEIAGDWHDVQMRLEGKEPPPRPLLTEDKTARRVAAMIDALGGPSAFPPGTFGEQPATSSDPREQHRRDKRRRQRQNRRRHRRKH